jgi:chitinase
VTENDAGTSGTYLYFEVTLSEPSLDEITFDFIASAGTAIEADFTGNTGLRTASWTIPAGETTALIPVRVYGDQGSGGDERDESMWLKLFNAQGAEFSDGATSATAIGVVADNDGSGANLGLFVSSPIMLEDDSGTSLAVFEIHLSRAHDTDLTFEYQTADGTARAGSDYAAKTGTVTFLAGQTTASVAVTVNGDELTEGSEFFSLVVTPTSEISNGTSGSTGKATILDDDDHGETGLPVINVERVDITENDSGTGGPYAYFQITLSEPSSDEISVSYRTAAGTAIDTDFSGLVLRNDTLVIPANTTTALIGMRVYGDDVDEVDEAFWLELLNPKGAVLAGGEPELSTIGVVLDEDGSGANLGLFVSSPTVYEDNVGTKSAVIEVHLSQAYETDLTFAFQTADGTAEAGSDYVAAEGSVTFLAGQTSTSIEITINGDNAIEKTENFSLVLTPTDDIKNGSAAHVGLVTILNDDTIHQIIEGGDGIDRLSGKSGDDQLYGLGGDDSLDGGKGFDRLFGGEGDDTLIGGKGRDDLYGDAGGDTFVFTKTSQSTVAIGGRDTIFDFSRKDGDHLDVDAIDAHTKLKGTQDFDFIGAKGFSGRGAELRFEKSNGDTLVTGDTNGDRKADFAILLEGSVALKDADFIL